VNVHPADLSVMEGGDRKYVGIHVVRDAILAGERELRSSTHIVREEVDRGEILMISKPLPLEFPEGVDLRILERDDELLAKVVDEHQERLKKLGDWVIYPLTLQMIAEGRFALDDQGVMHFDGRMVPHGHRL